MAHLQQQTPFTKKYDEEILVVPRKVLFEKEEWHGLKKDNLEYYVDLIKTHQEYHPRSTMEVDPAFKQIIPYVVFSYEKKLFVMQRRADATESRLQNKYTLGIGGHMRKSDMQGATIFDWATREFHEEVSYTGNLTMKPMGLLNDDSNEVGKVHLGLVLMMQGASDAISIKSELKNGTLMTFDECRSLYASFESWSQVVCDTILEDLMLNPYK